MKYLSNIIILVLLSSIFVYFPILKAEVAVIVHPNNTSTITQKDIKRIFLGKMKKFANGSSIIAINLSSGDASRDHFDQAVLGKTATKMKAFWAKQVFSGKGNPPKEVSSVADVLALVSENPAVIAYVESSKATTEVKVIGTY